MGTYLNPGKSGFASVVKSDYVDKTGLTQLINRTIGRTNSLTCVSRPRRFGKSYAAQMLCAYYDKTCDSRALFSGCEVSQDASFEEHLNKYDVIYPGMTSVIGETSADDIVEYVKRNVVNEICEQYGGVRAEEGFVPTLVNLVAHTNTLRPHT